MLIGYVHFAELNENVNLISMEKLDPGSPETWPEKSKSMSNTTQQLDNDIVDWNNCYCFVFTVPGVNEFAKLNSIANREEVPSWTQGLSQEDINSMHRKTDFSFLSNVHVFFSNYSDKYVIAELGALSQAGVVAEIRKLYDQAYQQGVEEAREMTRGKYLNIFSQNNRKK